MVTFYLDLTLEKTRDLLLSQSPILVTNNKLHLLPWSPGQDSFEWPSTSIVWIRLRGIPYHCWSSHILLSIASSIGLPLKLDDITASQKIQTYARILVNLDIFKPKSKQILVDLERESQMKMCPALSVSSKGILMALAQIKPKKESAKSSRMKKESWAKLHPSMLTEAQIRF